MSFSRPTAAFAAALGIGLSLLLAGCAPATDPEETRDSLKQVTEDPAPPEADDEFSAELHPEPIVEPIECTEFLVITARGTGEPSTNQLLSPVAKTIAKARPKLVEQLDLDYPADTDVKEGGTEGARRLVDTLNVQAEACPDQRFVLLGYSQGAMLVGDALSDPETRMVGETVGEVTEDAAKRIRAIVLYGDPRFVGAAPYNAGSFDPAINGVLPRPADALDAYADRLRDYCVAQDFVCQGSFDLDEQGHIDYFDNGMQADGAAFAITKLSKPDEWKDAKSGDVGAGDEQERPRGE